MKTSYIEVDPKTVKVDHSYGRPLSEPHVARLVKTWNPDLVGIITISARSNGTQICVDGQHRVHAAREVGAKSLPARLVEFESVEEEAEFFLGLNTMKAPRAIDRFKARLRAKDEDTVAIAKILKSYNISVAAHSGVGVLSSVTTVENLYSGGNLERTLEHITKAWPQAKQSRNDSVVLRAFQTLYSHHPGVDDERLRQILRTTALGSWVRQAKESAATFGGFAARSLANLWIAAYNKNQSEAKRLRPVARHSKFSA